MLRVIISMSFPMELLNQFCQKLARKTLRFDAPKDLFRGLRRPEETLPDNVLVFSRRGPHELQEMGQTYFHQRWVLLVPLKGEATVLIERKPHALGPGLVQLVPAFHLHVYTDMPATLHWLVITFEWPEHTAVTAKWNAVRTLNKRAGEHLFELVKAWDSPAAHGLRVAAELLAFLRELSPDKVTASPVQGSGDDEVIGRVRRMAADSQANLSVDAVARALGYSESHLRARFRQAAGLSLGRYLREAKLRQAAVWLKEDRIQVKDAAERAGYADVFAFSRAFVRTLGKQPAAMRRS